MFNFNFGKKRPDKKQIIIVSIILSSIVATLSQCSGVPEEDIIDIVDEIQRNLFPQTVINDVLIKDPNVVDRRVKRDVDNAIREYEKLTKDSEPPRIPLPRFTEKALDKSFCYSEECKKLGGEMRLCSPWMDGCEGVEIDKLKDTSIKFFKF